jgi:hypothetical protein
MVRRSRNACGRAAAGYGESVGFERSLTGREQEVLLHLLRGADSLSLALRERVADVRVIQEMDCCASIHISAGDAELWELTGWTPRAAEANWRTSPPRVVRLVIAATGEFSHLEITHEGEETGPTEFPPAVDLDEPVWRVPWRAMRSWR